MALTRDEHKTTDDQWSQEHIARPAKQPSSSPAPLKKLSDDDARLVREAVRRNRPVYDALRDS